jgi:hypothetical protein
MSFAVEQPRDGETILHCGHVEGLPHHWFQYRSPVQFTRPNGSVGKSQWLAICPACFQKHGDRAPVRGDGEMVGNAPVIRAPEEN